MRTIIGRSISSIVLFRILSYAAYDMPKPFKDLIKGMQTVTIELDIPMQILKTEDKDIIIADITGILMNKRTYTSEQLAEYDLEQYNADNNADESENNILARFGSDIYETGDIVEKQADEIKEIECVIAETLDAEGYLAKNIICNVGIEDPKANKVMTNVNDDAENARKADGDEILFEPDMNYITCEMLQMKIHPKELEQLSPNGEFSLTSFNDEIKTHKFKLCAEPTGEIEDEQGGGSEFLDFEQIWNPEIVKLSPNKTRPFQYNHHF